MTELYFDVDTVACEASESEILEEILSHAGVRTASIDLEAERIVLDVDASARDVEDVLTYLGLAVKAAGTAHPTSAV